MARRLTDANSFAGGGVRALAGAKPRPTARSTALYVVPEPAAAPEPEADESARAPDLRVLLARHLATTATGFALDTSNAALSVASCVCYVWESYVVDVFYERDDAFWTVELILGVYFSLDYALRVFVAERRLAKMASTEMLVDLVTIVPTLLSLVLSVGSDLWALARVLRGLRVLRVLRLQRMMWFLSEVRKQLLTMSLTLVSLVFLASAVIHVVENSAEARATRGQELKFHESAYFVIVTVTTVGFGDITPTNGYGMTVISLLIFSTLVLIPQQTNKLLQLLSVQSMYARKSFRPARHQRHVLVCGAVHDIGVRHFIHEFFHEDHSAIDLAHAVILGAGAPSRAVLDLLADPRYSIFVTFLEGSPLSPRDLARAQAHCAVAVFVLADKFADNPDDEDASNILRALSAKRFAGGGLPAYVQLIRPENSVHYSGGGWLQQQHQGSGVKGRGGRASVAAAAGAAAASSDVVIAIDQIKMNLLAKQCDCPGFATLVSNLVASSGGTVAELLQAEQQLQLAQQQGGGGGGGGATVAATAGNAPAAAATTAGRAQDHHAQANARWLREYLDGSSHEIYFVRDLNPRFGGFTFSQSAAIVMRGLQATLIGLELTVAGRTRILVNPGDFVVPDTTKVPVSGFVMCRDQRSADALSARAAREQWPRAAALGRELDAMEAERRPAAAKKQRVAQAGVRRRGTCMAERSRWATMRAKRHTDHNNDLRSMRQMLHAERAPRDLHDDALLTSVAQAHLSDHVLLCGNVSNLFHFVVPLREKTSDTYRPIVILHPELVPLPEWDKIAYFPEVYVVVGSPLAVEDLLRAGAHTAACAVVLQRASAGSSSRILADADTIFAYQGILALNPRINIITEILDHANIPFLARNRSSTGHAGEHYMITPPYAAGSVYTSSVLDQLIAQSFYNNSIMPLLRQLVSGEDADVLEHWQRHAVVALGEVFDSKVWQVPVPITLVGHTADDLFNFFIDQDVLVIGLLRGIVDATGIGAQGNRMPYVYCSPDPAAVLEEADNVFVLAPNCPEARTRRVAAHGQGVADHVVSLMHSSSFSDGDTPTPRRGTPPQGGAERAPTGPALDYGLAAAAPDLASPGNASMRGMVQALAAQQAALTDQVAAMQQQMSRVESLLRGKRV